MKTSRLTIAGFALLIALVMSSLVLFGCSSKTSTSAPAGTGKTLSIGINAWFGYPLGVDMINAVQLMADTDNKNGGLTIGGQKYQIKFIPYDNNNNQSTAQALINRLIFEDKVKFIIGESQTDPVVSITEANKVVFVAGSATNIPHDPKYKYVFTAGFNNGQTTEISGWIADNKPNIKKIVVAFPDSTSGHSAEPANTATLKSYGFQVQNEFYPEGASDLSALGTKVKQSNPDAFSAIAGGPISDALAIKAVYQAGWRGTLFANNCQPYLILSQLLPAEALEGYINGAWPVEFDPAITQVAKDFKAAYIAKYGKWNGPEIQHAANWGALRAALLKADSLDVDKVAAALGSGITFEGPWGIGKMISRPDLGITRTTDSIVDYYIKTITKGNPVQIGHLTLDQGLTYFRKFFK